MKTITIAGNVTRDSELRRLQDGTPVLGFSVAVSNRDKTATFFDVSVFGKRGEAIEQYITKGKGLCVSGEFNAREYEGKTYLQIRANEIHFMGSGKSEERPSYSDVTQGGVGDTELNEDSIPF